jgi:hypothetical protein
MRPRYLLWMWFVECIALNSARHPFGTLHKGTSRSWFMANLFCILCVGISEENDRNQSN